jgi:hypothetical protein
MFRNFLEVDVQELPRSRCSGTSSKSMFRNFLGTSSKSMFTNFLEVDVQ